MKPHPYDPKLASRARENRRNPSRAEQKMWYELLSNTQFVQHKFTRQKPLYHYIADFYCAELQLVIEIDGDSHVGNATYDVQRTRDLELHGITVIRYTNDEVLNQFDSVCGDLMQKIRGLVP